MDWNKAKNILIIAFIVTNLILLYVIIEDKNNSQTYLTVDQQFVEDVKDRLYLKDIKVDSDIPKEIPSMPLLYIEYEIYENPEEIAKNFLGEYTIEEKDGITYYVNGNERVTVLNGKELVYENTSNNKMFKNFRNIQKEELEEIVVEFLIEHQLDEQDYQLTSYKQLNGEYHLRYTKLYNDMLVEISYMKFIIDERGIKSFQRQWIKSIEPIESNITMRAAPDALLRLLLKEEHYGKTIKDIKLCYYFDPQKQSVGSWKNVVKGKAGPAWMVVFDDDSREFLEEY